ncbi:MAG: phosphoglycolate phosphatase [Azospirillum sp.]|nr:phosphoglycolate phosphatase [Azospirillum sp.]
MPQADLCTVAAVAATSLSALPFRAVVFDLDGTLIDSAPDITIAINRMLADHHRPPIGLAAIRSMVGDGAAALLDSVFEATGGRRPLPAMAEALACFLGHYGSLPASPSCLYPGVADTLAILSEAGLQLGLCTNKTEAITLSVLGQIGLERVFAAVAGGDTLPVKKPDGRHLRWVIDRLGAEPGSAVMVGDNGNDVKAARSAGVPVVAVSFGYPRMPVGELGADLVIDTMAALPAALAALAKGPRTAR